MEIKQAVRALTALAQESRLAVFRLLVRAGSPGLRAGEIAEALGIPPATLTFHLKELTHADLVESRRDGRSIIYSLRCDGMRELLTFLTRDCCQGQPELCGPVCCTPKRRAKASGR
jgi:ArsR family transcriptional regulator, arsenate/arsenite/antimonite-responsive transcriptional repressor